METAKKLSAWQLDAPVLRILKIAPKIASLEKPMNCLIFFPNELDRGLVSITDKKRLQYLHEFHELKEAQQLTVGLWNGNLGDGVIKEFSKEKTVLEVSLERSPPPREAVSLLVAVSRPPIVRKVLQYAAMMGLRSVIFFASERAEKTYLQSKALLPEDIQKSLLRGLEQAIDCVPPQISVCRSLSEALAQHQDKFCRKYFLHTEKVSSAIEQPDDKNVKVPKSTLLAIGPEAGLSSSEIGEFTRSGFSPIHLGPRVLRVEVACLMAVGPFLFHSL